MYLDKSKPKKRKIGRWILLLIIFFVFYFVYDKPIELNEKIEIKDGDTFYSFVNNLDRIDSIKMKIYLKLNNINFPKLEQGIYSFEGKYEKNEFVEVIKNGPVKDYVNYTILEGWSIYDIDYDLTKKGFINEGDYLSYILNKDNIKNFKNNYEFLQIIKQEILTLEGFLYPDTYRVDKGKQFVSQLVKMQLNNFQKKVWLKNKKLLNDYNNKLKNNGFDFELDWYDIVKLASIVEKEERNTKNKPVVAGIFLNRIQNAMRLDADITLCYGLKKPYETCTPKLISRSISDENNIYNTRKKSGLPPTPIANPHVESFDAILNFEKTDYFYYLHGNDGKIHYGKNVSEHNRNKIKYL